MCVIIAVVLSAGISPVRHCHGSIIIAIWCPYRLPIGPHWMSCIMRRWWARWVRTETGNRDLSLSILLSLSVLLFKLELNEVFRLQVDCNSRAIRKCCQLLWAVSAFGAISTMKLDSLEMVQVCQVWVHASLTPLPSLPFRLVFCCDLFAIGKQFPSATKRSRGWDCQQQVSRGNLQQQGTWLRSLAYLVAHER